MRYDDKKRHTGPKAGVIGALLLAGTVGLGPAAAAQHTELGAGFEPGTIAGIERGVSLLAQAEGGFGEFAGDDDVFDANDEGFLFDPGSNEIGFDEDASGTLDENEVLGTDENNDEALTEDEFMVGAGAGAEADVGSSPVADAEATPVTDTLGVFGDDERFDANDEGFLREDLNNDQVFEIGVDEDQSGTLDENEVLGSDVDNDEGLGAPLSDGATGTGTEDEAQTVDFASIAGDDATFDANDQGFLSEDVDGDGTNEIGFDENEDGVLDENEVLGTDFNEDDVFTEEELGPEVSVDGDNGMDAGAAATGDFASIAGDDNTFDANDEGFLFDPGSNEIGFDEDASGTLEENEVLGTDENNDEALTEDELGV